MIYVDNAATTPVKHEVLKEMVPFFCEYYGNPSSIYKIGRQSKKAIEISRKKVANLINADKNEIYFTSCGSESDNTALKGIAYENKNKGNHIITSKIEHPAILDTCKFLETHGFEITYLNVDKYGFINLAELENSINDNTILISIMFANNEIGTIEPIEEIAKIAHKHNILFHTDAVQAIGNIPIDVKKLNIDLLSMSGHKIYGPKGVGGLYVKNGIKFQKFINGGHQEKNKRAGTENVAEIVGLGKACEIANSKLDEHIKNMEFLRDYFISKIRENINDIKINGPESKRLPGNVNISFKNIDGMALILELDKKGICASSGSACTMKTQETSHVLLSIGLPYEYANGTLRCTFGEFNKKWEIDYIIKNLKEIVENLRK